MEGYHIPQVHPELNKEVDMATYHVYPVDRIARHESSPHKARESDAINDGLWLWIWPNISINIYRGGMNLEIMVPTGMQSVELQYYYLFKDISEGNQAEIKKIIDMSEAVTNEDVDICEAVQKNLNAGIYEAGELSPRHEKGVKYFHDLVREALNIVEE